MLVVHNEELRKRIKTSDHYTLKDIQDISTFLEKKGTFNFSPFENGLFPAARVNKRTEYTGYANVWVRDNIQIAHAHYAIGSIDIAARNANTLMSYFKKYQKRLKDIIKSGKAPQDPMKRPHIRFNGNNLEEISSEKWSHAQNDALGYFLWFYCLLLNQEILETKQENIDMLALLVLYFKAVCYWQDEDSGHWEETRKINASSIGVVVVGLKELQQILLKNNMDCKYKNINIRPVLKELINKGREALKQILPNECIQNDPAKKRAYDAALLFLVYPLNVVNERMADKILGNIEKNLLGDYGIRRYIGDSFWAPDYKKVPQEKRTSYLGNDISERDTLLTEKGKEAQWCIFDPIISIIYGKRFQKTGQEKYLNKQIYFLNRSLGQITEGFECPELYYLEGSKYVHGDVVPLLWTQANLRLALKVMELNAQMG